MKLWKKCLGVAAGIGVITAVTASHYVDLYPRYSTHYVKAVEQPIGDEQGRLNDSRSLESLLTERSSLPTPDEKKVLEQEIRVSTQDSANEYKEIIVPHKAFYQWKPGRCSLVARELAEMLFGLKYSKANAWDRKYTDQCIGLYSSNKEFKEALDKGTVPQGAIIGGYLEGSPNLQSPDMYGKPREWTHAILYMGLNKEGEHLFAHLMNQVHVDTFKELTSRGITGKAAFMPKYEPENRKKE